MTSAGFAAVHAAIPARTLALQVKPVKRWTARKRQTQRQKDRQRQQEGNEQIALGVHQMDSEAFVEAVPQQQMLRMIIRGQLCARQESGADNCRFNPLV